MKREARRYHRNVWAVLGIALPLLVIAMFFLKQTAPVEQAPVQLEPAKEN